jgi:hypothetical protein
MIKIFSFIIFATVLLFACEKENDDRGLFYNNHYLVSQKIDLEINEPIITSYEYDNYGRLIKIGDTTTIYIYSDTLIYQIDHYQSFVSIYHYLNSKMQIEKTVFYFVNKDPIDENIQSYITYKYDSLGQLIEESTYLGNIHAYNYTYIWDGGNINECIQQVLSVDNISSPFTRITKYIYYSNLLNNYSFGFDFYGNLTKNLIKQKIIENEGWEKYSYELDSRNRPVKETKTSMTYTYNYSHYSDYPIDSTFSTWVTGYEY